MRRSIDPTVDVVFKEILGSDHHKSLLVNFLNAILGYEKADRVVDVIFRDPFISKAFVDGKLSVVDVRAIDQRGREFQIEIQVSSNPTLPQRMLHNWCGLYHGRIIEGQAFNELEPVIAIWLLVGELPPLLVSRGGDGALKLKGKKRVKSGLVHLAFGIYCPEGKRFLTDHCAIHVLQLKHWPRGGSIDDDKGRWISFFKEGKNLDPDNPPGWMETPEMREAMSILRKFSEQEKNYHLYLSRLNEWRARKTEANDLDRAKKDVEKAQQRLAEERAKRKSEKAQAVATIDRLRDQLRRAGLDPDAP